jgi:low affinity Fe/Cu permease
MADARRIVDRASGRILQNRDTLAIQAKLDELLRAEHRARSELTTLDQKEPEEIVRHRARQRQSGTNG